VSKTISIPEDLGHRCDWRTCRSRRGFLDASRKILGCAGLLVLTDSSQRSFSRFWSLFLEHSEDGPHTLLNGGLRRIPITLTGNRCRNLLNLCLQHLIEAQPVLSSYCEAVHLGIDVLQELVSGMNLSANFIIYPYLIPDDISKRGFISVGVLPIPPYWQLSNGKLGLFHPALKPSLGQKPLLELPMKLTSWGTLSSRYPYGSFLRTLHTLLKQRPI
jgi:hypothetical protein